MDKKRKYNKLTAEEKKVIVEKKTEAPFSGEYDNFWGKGIYVCKRCNAPLYKSDDKFNFGCGWPSFEKEISKSIATIPDINQMATEIVCANCGAHLGHIFTGEKNTPNGVRHCINSISLKFVAKK